MTSDELIKHVDKLVVEAKEYLHPRDDGNYERGYAVRQKLFDAIATLAQEQKSLKGKLLIDDVAFSCVLQTSKEQAAHILELEARVKHLVSYSNVLLTRAIKAENESREWSAACYDF